MAKNTNSNKKNIHDTNTASTNDSKSNVDTTFIKRRYHPARIKHLPRKYEIVQSTSVSLFSDTKRRDLKYILQFFFNEHDHEYDHDLEHNTNIKTKITKRKTITKISTTIRKIVITID